MTKGNWTADVTGYNSILFGRGTGTQDPNSTQISDLTLQTVELTASTTAVTYLPNPALLGNDVTFTATIDPGTGTTNPTGTVQFKVDGVNFGTPVAVTNGTGLTATATSSSINTLSLGDHTILAIYSGDATYSASSGSVTATINTGSTVSTTTLASSLNPALRNDNITFTATVNPGTGTTNPTGTVQFKVDNTNFGAPVAVTNGTGLTATASVSSSTLSPGSHEIVAIYSGDQTYTTSTSDPLTQTVNLPPVPANLLFSDDFDRGPAPLHGSMPTLVNPAFYPTGVTWSSTGSNHNNTITANGGQEIGGWNASLPFTPVAGNIYKWTMTVGPTIENALQIAFGNHSGGFSDYNFLSQDVANMAWVRIGAVEGGIYDYGNRVANVNSTVGTYTLDADTGPGFVNTFDLILDVTSGLATAQLTWKINSVTKATWTADVSTYNAIMFGRGTGPQDPNSTQISDLALTLENVAPPTTPYEDWADTYPGADLTDPAADYDGDGVSNQNEFAFALDPTSGASSNPITSIAALQNSPRQFSYQRNPDSGLAYTILASTDLQTWVEDSGTQGTPVPGDGFETVTVTVATPPVDGKLFVRVKAD